MKKLMAMMLLVGLSIMLVFATAMAQNGDEPVYINPYFDENVSVQPGQEVILWNGWLACTRGQTRSFLTAVHQDWYLDGQPLFASDEDEAQYWSPIEPAEDTTGCISGHEGQAWLTLWFYSLGSFEEGQHPLSLELWLDHPVNDGYDGDGDGQPDKYSGSFGLSTMDILVAP